jgi:WD repeat-containing protein 61
MDSMIKVWDVIRGTEVATIEAAPVEAWTLSFSPDSRFVATGTQVREIQIFINTSRLEM